MSVDPQIDAIEKDLDDLIASFDFTAPGIGESIGKGALALISGRIQERNRRQEAPGGGAWDENKGWALVTPLKIGKPIGVLSNPDGDSMLAALQIDGEQTITADTASMVYGVSDFAKRKSMWFSNGSIDSGDGTEKSGAINQAPRPFYSLDDSDREALDTYFHDTFDAVMRRHPGVV